MRRILFCAMTALFLASGGGHPLPAAPKPDDAKVILSGPVFTAVGLKFTIPSKWQPAPVESAARAGQWIIPVPRGQEGGPGEVVAYYFGPNLGGTAKDNIDGWIATMTTPDGHPAAGLEKNHEINGCKISQVVVFGTYNQPVPIAGIPPQPHPKYGLVGAVIETSQGTIYWRFTGPEPLVTANLALFNKIIDSLKPNTP